jgi:cell division protein FtsX
MHWRAGFAGAVLAAGACLIIGPPAVASDGPQEVGYRDLHDPDAEVFMLVRATRDEVAAVRHQIEGSKLVKRFAFLDKADAYQVFSHIFRKDPDLVANVSPESLPMSFEIDLREFHDRPRFQRQFEFFAGVDQVRLPRTAAQRAAAKALEAAKNARCGIDEPIEVFLEVRATPADEKVVAAALRETPQVKAIRKINRNEAKRVFNCLFSDDPNLTKNVDAESLPVSFRVEVRNGTNLHKLARMLGSITSVDSVEIHD